MRLQRLDLIRYGKFTGTSINLPSSGSDFHLIVGANEAGKSTVRTAITELLFGIPKQSPMGFIHPQAELRLGAVLEGAGSRLEFQRTKSTKNPLRTTADEPLSDDKLAALLGAADRSFFARMYGLDHAQLVLGGQSILDASDDVGQVLFQSASGIASLGKVREALEAEADSLWAPRRSMERSYYVAATALDGAERELREATVRTRSWTEAQTVLRVADERWNEIQESLRTLKSARTRLERIRRTASLVQQLRSTVAELDALGPVVELPADASRTLNEGQADLAVKEAVMHQREQDVTRARASRDAIQYDGSLLERRAEIEALETLRQRVSNHGQDLLRRRGEVDQLLQQARTACGALGWPEGEAEVRALLPSSSALKAVARLLSERGAVMQNIRSKRQAVADKTREIENLAADLAREQDLSISAELRAALTQAQVYRNAESSLQARSDALALAERNVTSALDALGTWSRSIDALRAMTLPSVERLTALRTQRSKLEGDVGAARQRANEANVSHEDAQLAARQFEAARQVVTADEVRDARAKRDQTWSNLKTGVASLESSAAALDSEIDLADQLADAQLASATAAAELQSLRQRIEREAALLLRTRALLDERQADLQAFEQEWSRQATSLRLDGMALDDMAGWLGRRDAALAAADVRNQKQADLDREQSSSSAALNALQRQLRDAGHPVTSTTHAAVCADAEELIREADGSRERRREMARQLEVANRALAALTTSEKLATDEHQEWETAWAKAVEAAKLSTAGKSPAEVEPALELVNRVAESLSKAASIRIERIDAMNLDLEHFADQAHQLATRIGVSQEDAKDPAAFSQAQGRRLGEASAAYEQWRTVDQALQLAISQVKIAKEGADTASARLSPLLNAAGVTTPAEALPLVERSDRHRAHLQTMDSARHDIVANADGLSLEAIIAEVEAVDPNTLDGELAKITQRTDELEQESTGVIEQRLSARQAFDAISGGADAATAESRRQEALAAMAVAAERYLKLATASRLLRWAIDRYRDRQQGPLLARASEIFAGLTLGRYQKLLVDSDQEPPTLVARREGAVVGVPGLSEGTRDQLYLALRLAALELHLNQSSPLPFIADDLFINFDEARSKAGLQALKELSASTQVIFLTHHDHLAGLAREVFGNSVNVVELAV
jgi:uncharacterized protein YhaN